MAILTLGFHVATLPSDVGGNGRASQAARIVADLEQGLENYHLEYSTYPDLGNDFTTDRDNGIELLNVLLAQTDHKNAKAIKFVETREGRNFKDGVIWDPKTSEILGLYDPWSNAYVIHIGSKTANEVHFTWGSKFIDLNDRHIAIYSPGRDLKAGTSDDICSWRAPPRLNGDSKKIHDDDDATSF